MNLNENIAVFTPMRMIFIWEFDVKYIRRKVKDVLLLHKNYEYKNNEYFK